MNAPVIPMTGMEATPTARNWGAISRHRIQMGPPMKNHLRIARQNLVKRPYALTNPNELSRESVLLLKPMFTLVSLPAPAL